MILKWLGEGCRRILVEIDLVKVEKLITKNAVAYGSLFNFIKC